MATPPVRFRHLKRGKEYTVLGEAGVQAEQPVSEGDQVTVYQGDDGQLWVRPIHEFHDGRFEPVAPV